MSRSKLEKTRTIRAPVIDHLVNFRTFHTCIN